MNVLVIGANGKIARHLVEELKETDHHVTALIRKEEQSEELKSLGADETLVRDLEGDISDAFAGKDAAVFAAGSGGHTGPDKTTVIDLWGSRKSVEASKAHGVKRFIQVSSMNTDEPENGPEKMRHYFIAKRVADDYLEESGLDYTIVRPGLLTNDDPSGTVELKQKLNETGEIPRADVAKVIAASLDTPGTIRKKFDLIGGDKEIIAALNEL